MKLFPNLAKRPGVFATPPVQAAEHLVLYLKN